MIGKGIISDEITFTGQLIEQGKEFLFTKGIDLSLIHISEPTRLL